MARSMSPPSGSVKSAAKLAERAHRHSLRANLSRLATECGSDIDAWDEDQSDLTSYPSGNWDIREYRAIARRSAPIRRWAYGTSRHLRPEDRLSHVISRVPHPTQTWLCGRIISWADGVAPPRMPASWEIIRQETRRRMQEWESPAREYGRVATQILESGALADYNKACRTETYPLVPSMQILGADQIENNVRYYESTRYSFSRVADLVACMVAWGRDYGMPIKLSEGYASTWWLEYSSPRVGPSPLLWYMIR